MKKLLMASAALATGALTALAGGSAEALLKLIDSRSMQSPKVCEAAAREVRASADAGSILHRYVIAVVAEDVNAPAAARLSPQVRKEWLDAARPRIRDMAERKDNSLAWFLLSMESGDRAQLERAADGGNVQALNALGTHLISVALSQPATNSVQIKAAMTRAINCYKTAAGKRDANGLYNLGMCYMHGYGCDQDAERAFHCFRSAAEFGHPEAINNIGGCYRDGILVPTNQVAAVRWFKRSADLGNPYGELNYALALQRGDGVRRDEALAAELLADAAEHGNAEAMNVYGMCFHAGRGVKRDLETAFLWFRRSAERGFPPAMDNLAFCYGNGVGTTRDVLKSALWKMRSRAANGDPDAIKWVKENEAVDGR